MERTRRTTNVNRSILTLIGISVFVSVHGVLLATGVPVPPTDVGTYASLPGVLYASAVLGSVAFVAAGRGVSAAGVTWRHLACLGYVLLAVPLAASPAFVDVTDQAYGGRTTFLVLAALAVLLLLAMAVDILLDSRVIVTFEAEPVDAA